MDLRAQEKQIKAVKGVGEKRAEDIVGIIKS
jgi:DNA uptake protein ComE-like DNA-binding protein